MIIILLLIKVICIFPNTQFKKDQQISLYPTVGEFYEYYLESLLQESQLICKMHPQIPNVQLINQCEEIYQIQGQQYISMSSNNTHFSTLSNNNEIIIYEWKNQMIQQIGVSVFIDPLYNCFNIDLFLNQKILVDCYYNNELLLIQIIDSQSIIAYQIQSNIPTSTKIQSIVNGTNIFIVYAQYFKKYSILTLFSSSFKNLSSLNNQFIDFDIPITISPNIYAITFQNILQLSISQDYQFNLIYNFSYDGMSNFKTINVFYNLWSYSQCDQIQLSYLKLSKIKKSLLLGCQNIIITLNQGLLNQFSQPILKILQSDQFIICQFIDKILIKQQKTKEQFTYNLTIQNNSLLYFNSDNQLFLFNQEIKVYQIKYTSFSINLTTQENSKLNYTFQLICKNISKGNYTYTYSNFYLQILSQNDTNIYVMYNQDFPFQQSSLNYDPINPFYSFSGQLLQYNQNQDEPYFNFKLITFQNVGEIIQSYQFLSFISMNYPFVSKQYLIGYINQSLNLLSCFQKSTIQSYQFTTLSSINISVNASSLQVAYSIYPDKLIIGLSTNDTIYLFLYKNESTIPSVTQSNYTFEQEFSDFIVTYNSIIILIEQQEIQILTFNYTVTYTLNQQSINKLFNNITFNPIQIVMNTQSVSSFVYINNINELSNTNIIDLSQFYNKIDKFSKLIIDIIIYMQQSKQYLLLSLECVKFTKILLCKESIQCQF
ncbi:unnamed protein product [Paramecium primaurelia]|uniref:Transmembrane protein n=1 Tax=Paramecium primaurelia TaxID=5886 RepID=A0A8S1QUL1_PARPR|nr:unnamed protein product [Paramecium primaurelia]